jgi:phospholipase C
VATIAMTMLVGACGAASSLPGRNQHSPATSSAEATERAAPGSGPCDHPTASPVYRHVIWIWMENESFGSVIGSSDAPYLTSLAGKCGLATNYQAISHPSLPNYLAATGGSTFSIVDDVDPSGHPIKAPSIFGQVGAAGLTWRSYEESMPMPCDTHGSGLYAPRHNPAVYYVPLRLACHKSDITLGSATTGALAKDLQAGTLPSFAFVTPNLCHDGHNCSVQDSDRWLSKLLPVVFSSPTYRSGQTAVFVAWDEGVGDNHVPLIVAAPTVRAGTKSHGLFNHYSLLRTTEDLLGLPPLGRSANAASMVAAFNL